MIIARLLAGLALVGLVAVARAHDGGSSSVDRLKVLVEKVNDLVNWRLDDLGSLKTKDLSDLYEEYSRLSDNDKAELEREPLAKLTIDFAVKPCKFLRNQLVASDAVANENYMIRMTRALRYFWPAYQGFILSRIDLGRRLHKMRKLVKDLREGKTPTVKELLAIQRERQALLARAQEIIDHEDIFSNIQEYAEILQGYNWLEHKLAWDKLVALVGPNTTADELAKLVKQFKTNYGGLFNA